MCNRPNVRNIMSPQNTKRKIRNTEFCCSVFFAGLVVVTLIAGISINLFTSERYFLILKTKKLHCC